MSFVQRNGAFFRKNKTEKKTKKKKKTKQKGEETLKAGSQKEMKKDSEKGD